MVKNNNKISKNNKVINFIHFMQNEFGVGSINAIKKTERKIVKKIKSEHPVASEKFHKIGKLIDEALKHLPDEEIVFKDHDDRHSDDWKKTHSEIKDKLHKEKNNNTSGKMLLVSSERKSVENISFNYDWKTLSLAVFLFSIILMNCFFCLKPQAVITILAYADKLVASEKQIIENKPESTLQVAKLSEIGIGEAEIAEAKARFIKENQESLRNKKAVGISAKDLFGQLADASVDDGATQSYTVKSGKIDKIVDTIKISWINFFKELNLK